MSPHDAVVALAIGLLLAFAAIRRPHSASCGPGWVDGVRPDGRYGCRPAPIRDTDAKTEVDDGTLDIELKSRIYCTNGTRPIVVDAHTVGCQRKDF